MPISNVGKTSMYETNNLQLESLELAGCTLDRHIIADNSRPSFLEITGVSTQRRPTCSGLSAGDYRNLPALLNHPHLSQLKILNKVPLPPEIMEHFAHMQCHCLMGVFPEIGRAWLTIDSNIYVWSLGRGGGGCGGDVAYFDGLSETIVSVGLVRPKLGVFQSFVKYLLVLTTTIEIVVLGVTFSCDKSPVTSPLASGGLADAEFGEMQLVPDPVLVLPTDGVSMIAVAATALGRIFLGGKDGCLYEITYQAKLGWFGKHSKKINHSTSTLSFLVPSFISGALYDEDPIVKIQVDNSRHILYTLSEKGCIEVYDLGRKGDCLSKVTRMTQGKIVTVAMDIVKTLEASNFKPVIAISAIELSESEHLNLVAVTQTGTRLYFTTGYENMNPNEYNENRPLSLTMLHVRLPPGFTPDASVSKPKHVHNAVYDNGTMLMVCSPSSPGAVGGGGEPEVLWCVSRVLPGGEGILSEAHTLMPLEGPVWTLTPLLSPQDNLLSEAIRSKKDLWSISRWAIMSGSGAWLVKAGAAPDLLRTLLRECHGPEHHPVKQFFQVYNCEQACACAAYLACEDVSTGDPSIPDWACRALQLYGSHPLTLPQFNQPNTHMTSTMIGSPKFSPRQMSTPMSMRGPAPQHGRPGQGPLQRGYPMQPRLGTSPQSPYNQSIPSPAFNISSFNGSQAQQNSGVDQQPPVELSARHNGIYIYVGRILASIWQIKCVSISFTPENQEFLSSTVTGEDCAYVTRRLQRVVAFLLRFPLLATSPTATNTMPHSEELRSLHALQQFISLAIEMLSLWRILCEHQFHVIAAGLPTEQQAALKAASFRELLVGGQEIACLLAGTLVGGYLRDNASVDGISHKLRQLCPALYRQEDATCSKANELLLFAKQQKNPNEKEEMLQSALKLCKDVAPHINLPLVCSKLISVGFYSGVVELCSVCAAKIDPQNKALHYYKNEQPTHDHEGQLAYYRRMDIYQEVCLMFERLYERSAGAPVPSPEPAPPPPSVPDSTLTLSPADANYQGRRLVWECLTRDDELLHVAVYEWLVFKRLGSELLSLGVAPPASLRTYLQIAARKASPSAALHLLDLLWKVLEKSGEHLAAAHVLESLATRPGSGATLDQRMSWLSAGVVCVRGGGGGGGGELLRRLEEAAEVARVQATVRSAAAGLPRLLQPPPQQMQRLDDELLDITQLYEEYADRYNLWECKLAIVHCSGHNDPLLLENIWSNILAEAEDAARSVPTNTPDECLSDVLGRVATLGNEYANTGHCFPLHFIVRQLEIMSCKLQADHRLVFKAMLNIGVSLEQLLDIYIKLVSSGERVWLGAGDEAHISWVCATLLEAAREDILALPAPARRRTLARCKDLHEAALSAAQTRPNSQQLIERLSAAQAYLDRLE